MNKVRKIEKSLSEIRKILSDSSIRNLQKILHNSYSKLNPEFLYWSSRVGDPGCVLLTPELHVNIVRLIDDIKNILLKNKENIND